MIAARRLDVSLGRRPVLRGVDVRLDAGELVGVLGANGAGKSTLLRTLAGLIVPERGQVQLDGRPLSGIAAAERARSIGYLPQDRIVHWPLSARAVVTLGRDPHRSPGGRATADDDAAIEDALRRMDATALADRPVTELSGGERARVLLARALAGRPRALIADEPTAGLDPAHQLALFATLAALARDGTGIMLALHDLSLAAAYCHRIVLLAEGQVLADGPPRAVLVPDLLAAAYKIRARLADIDGRLIVIPEAVLP